jgi:anti-anti-sigma regulatory factor
MSELTSTLVIEKGALVCHLTGAITESAAFDGVVQEFRTRGHAELVIDLVDVKRINSAGVREWIGFLRALASCGASVVLQRVSPALVRQLSMVRNTRGGARVTSIGLPYICEDCDEERVVDGRVDGDRIAMPESAPRCAACDREMIFDDVIDGFLAFLRDVQSEP